MSLKGIDMNCFSSAKFAKKGIIAIVQLHVLVSFVGSSVLKRSGNLLERWRFALPSWFKGSSIILGPCRIPDLSRRIGCELLSDRWRRSKVATKSLKQSTHPKIRGPFGSLNGRASAMFTGQILLAIGILRIKQNGSR